MQLVKALYRNSILFFTGCFLIVIWGFWRSYYSDPFQTRAFLVQLHGLVMTLWFLMLGAQAYLIRTNRRPLHRLVGKASYVVAPLVVALPIILIRDVAVRRLVQGASMDTLYFLLAYILGAALVFGILYGLAIYNRHNASVHARWMVCTPVPLMNAATDRIVGQYLEPLSHYLPRHPAAFFSDGYFVALAGFAIGDVVLVVLAVWDWISHRRIDVFLPALLLVLAYQIFVVIAHEVPFWSAFSLWFIG